MGVRCKYSCNSVWDGLLNKALAVQMMENADSKSCLTSKDDDTNTTMEQSMGLVSRCTLSSSVSAATVARFSDDKSAVDVEASCSGQQAGLRQQLLCMPGLAWGNHLLTLIRCHRLARAFQGEQPGPGGQRQFS